MLNRAAHSSFQPEMAANENESADTASRIDPPLSISANDFFIQFFYGSSHIHSFVRNANFRH